MKKKIVCMLLAVTMSVSMLAGCSNKEVSDEAVNMTETMEEAKTK